MPDTNANIYLNLLEGKNESAKMFKELKKAQKKAGYKTYMDLASAHEGKGGAKQARAIKEVTKAHKEQAKTFKGLGLKTTLTLMFAFQNVTKAITSLLQPAQDLLGINEIYSTFLAMKYLPTAEKQLEQVMAFGEEVGNLSDYENEQAGDALLAAQRAAKGSGFAQQTAMAFSAIGKALPFTLGEAAGSIAGLAVGATTAALAMTTNAGQVATDFGGVGEAALLMGADMSVAAGEWVKTGLKKLDQIDLGEIIGDNILKPIEDFGVWLSGILGLDKVWDFKDSILKWLGMDISWDWKISILKWAGMDVTWTLKDALLKWAGLDVLYADGWIAAIKHWMGLDVLWNLKDAIWNAIWPSNTPATNKPSPTTTGTTTTIPITKTLSTVPLDRISMLFNKSQDWARFPPSAAEISKAYLAGYNWNPFNKNWTYMQAGGIVNRPTSAILGERGPEAVIPLDRIGSIGGINVTINTSTIGGNTDQLARELAEKFSFELGRVRY